MYRPEHKNEKSKLQITFNDGGCGDHIARMTAVKYLRDTYNFLDIHLFCPDYFVPLAENLVTGITVHPFSRLSLDWDTKCPFKQTRNPAHDTLATHLVDNAFSLLVNQQVSIEHKNYCQLDTSKIDVSKFTLPENYVVVSTGFTAAVREMIPETVNSITSYLNSKGVTPVFLGSRQTEVGIFGSKITGSFKDEIDYGSGIDLIDQTTLLESGKIISQSKAIIGVDNGLCHLAGTTSVPIVVGFTTVRPEHRVPYRKNSLGFLCFSVTPSESLACRFCQSNWRFTNNHDFKSCFYDDYICTKELTADKYIYFLEKIL